MFSVFFAWKNEIEKDRGNYIDFPPLPGMTSGNPMIVSIQVRALNWYSKWSMVTFHGPIISTETSSQGCRSLICFGRTCPYLPICLLYLWQNSHFCTNCVIAFVMWGNQKCFRKVADNQDMPTWPNKLWIHLVSAYWMAWGVTIFGLSNWSVLWWIGIISWIVNWMKLSSSLRAFINS